METLDRAKAGGNALVGIDGFWKLRKINSTACKDRLRGYFGAKHGDWERANEQAETSMDILDGICKQEIGFREAYKAEKKLQRDQARGEVGTARLKARPGQIPTA
ncbi:hypothetical protein [Burkholderia pseudomallei]|uniref:hypothetical protein n=1 Tax=Burkholderia pseudomallei TaxID=28450 RepID=UPI0018C480E0|nr:hypothetical protein [Burkholderia pseudomallei]MBG1252186.1 hypothetical protein [Burkholderia pseudomallei]